MIIKDTDLLRILRRKAKESNLNALAKEWGFDQGYLYKVWNGEKPISPKIALKLGFKSLSGTFQKL